MQIAVGQDYKTAFLAFCIFAGLLFADKGIFAFGFRFKNDNRKAFFVQQEKIDEALFGFFEVFAKSI